MKTSRNPNRGSVKSSLHSQKLKKAESSSKHTEKISKYFNTSKSSGEDSSTSQIKQEFDSPFKKALSEIKYVPIKDDLNRDFRTPKPIKVQKKIQDKKLTSTKLNKSKPKSKSSNGKSTVYKNSFFKTTQDNFGQSDVNPEHLQMALALSKSTYAVEYPEHSKDEEDNFHTFLTPEKIPKGKTTLERYGFKSDKPKLHPEFRREHVEVPKRKNSKFRYLTPTLKTRTNEERQEIIASKISLILGINKDDSFQYSEEKENANEICSDFLKRFQANYSLITANAYSSEETNDKYYSKDLNILPTKYKCGCLLKNWDDIPGREKSPTRTELKSQQTAKTVSNISVFNSEENKVDFEIHSQHESALVSQSQKLSVEYPESRDCISPDLFESESETEFTPDTVDDFSQSLLSPSKKKGAQSSWSDSLGNKTTIDSKTSDSQVSVTKDCSINISQSENKDTEELFLNYLKEKELVANATPSPKKQRFSQHSEEDLLTNLGENSSSKSQQQVIIEDVVDLTLSSSNDSTSDIISEKYNKDSDISVKSLQEPIRNTNAEDFNTEMSLLQIKDSNNLIKNVDSTEKHSILESEDIFSNISSRKSFEIDGLDNCSAMLNVTDYITQILSHESKTDSGGNGVYDDLKMVNTSSESYNDKIPKRNQDDDINSSQGSCSQESIVISDEELNYSSINSKETKFNKYFYNISDVDEENAENQDNNDDLMDIDEIYSVHSELKSKYRRKSVSTPMHNRISELQGKTSLGKMSPMKAFLEDSFNELLENTNVLRALEDEANQKTNAADESVPTNRPFSPSVEVLPENKNTPEKIVGASENSNICTPENNLIIKTKDITPLVNYDEMDTPGIANELQKFGLKPLKRQRGVKLLKYIYECTHPLVGPNEIEDLSSDEDDRVRVRKKRKKMCENADDKNKSIIVEKDNLEDIELIGDKLLKNVNFEELIFERKSSVKIPSCRVPLQIVWHNFLSKNSHIKQNILLYEPLQLEVLHEMIKEQTGCKFHIQDLLTFFDRKCITIRTAQGSQKGKRRA